MRRLPDAERDRLIARAIIDWFRAGHRAMPWRATRDAYAIWVSEVMLQQTRVDVVVPYYERWMARFPTVAALAAAELDEVLPLWSGLGYYARARNLHAAARAVVERHAGRVPAEPEALRALPGVGAYTAGAIRSLAFDARAAVVDGNVERVLARVDAIDDVASAAGKRALWARAEALVPSDSPGDYNQGLMELGATVCTPRDARCLLCPLSTVCRAHAAGDPLAWPRPKPKRAPREVVAAAVLVERAGKILLVRRPPDETLWGGLWEPPWIALDGGAQPDAVAAARALEARVGVGARAIEAWTTFEHVLTHRRIRFHAFRARAVSSSSAGPRDGVEARWVARHEHDSLALAAWVRSLLDRLDAASGSNQPNDRRNARGSNNLQWVRAK
jgi:A/G-specific adenine glycosylase